MEEIIAVNRTNYIGLLEENRTLRVELAKHETHTRLELSENTFLVSEGELPRYIPYTKRQIKKLREEGILRYFPDALGRKTKYLYNLREVEATLLASRTESGPILMPINWAGMRKTGS